MTIIWAGGELESYQRSATNVAESSVGGSFDATYQREALRVGSSSASTADWLDGPNFGPQSYIWHHFDWYQASGADALSVGMRTYYNNAGVAGFRIYCNGTTVQPQYWNGSAWTAVGAVWNRTAAIRYNMDLYLMAGAAGSVKMYANGNLVSEGTGNFAALTDIAKIRGGNNNPGSQIANNPFYSQDVVSNTPTVGWKSECKPPISQGIDNGGTGTWVEVDEAALNDADVLILTNVGDKSCFKSAARNMPINYIVKGITVGVRAKCGASGPTGMKIYLVIGGVRYYSPTITLTTILAPYWYTWDLNPATGTQWLEAAAEDANLEWGIEAA